MSKGSYIGGSTILRIWPTSSAGRRKVQGIGLGSAEKAAVKRARKALAQSTATAELRKALDAAAETRTAERAAKATSPENLARVAERERAAEARMAKIVIEKRKLPPRQKS